MSEGDASFLLWFEWLSGRVMPDRLARWSQESDNGRQYAVLAVVALIDLGLNLLAYVLVPPHRLISPFWVVIPLGLGFALLATRDLKAQYLGFVQEHRQVTTADGVKTLFDVRTTFPPRWLRVGILFAVLGGFAAYFLLQPAYLLEFYAERGPIIGTLQLVGIGPVYMMIIGDFGIMVISCLIYLPFVFLQQGLPADFSDPAGDAGLAPYGQLVERAIVYYFVGVVLYSIRLLQEPNTILFRSPGGVGLSLFILIWSVGIVLYAVPALSVRHLLAERKEELVTSIDQKIRDLGEDQLSLPGTDFSSDRLECVRRELEIQRVERAKQNPIPATKFAATAAMSVGVRALSYLNQTFELWPPT